MIITEYNGSYEHKTDDGRVYRIHNMYGTGKYYADFQFKSVDYQPTGKLVHGIPNKIKSVVFKISRNDL